MVEELLFNKKKIMRLTIIMMILNLTNYKNWMLKMVICMNLVIIIIRMMIYLFYLNKTISIDYIKIINNLYYNFFFLI